MNETINKIARTIRQLTNEMKREPTPDEISETMILLSLYTGFPAANNGIFALKEVLDETNYTALVGVPLNPKAPVSAEVILGRSEKYYASTENFYLVNEKYSYYGW